MLVAYIDESYNHRTEKRPHDPLLYTVGCWVSTVEQWKKFNKKWRAALNNAGVEWFHMAAYESRKGEYEFWSNLKRIGVLKRLHRIIKDHVVHGVTVSVNKADYDAVMSAEWKRVLGTTYYSFDVRMVMKYLAEWADDENEPGPIDYVFAELRGQGGELDKIFREMLSKPRDREWLRLSGMWTKGLMQEVTQLQAADVIAYELNKRAVNHVGTDDKFVRKSLNNLAQGIYQDRLAPLYFGRAELLRLQYEMNRGTPR